ncbi:hypothetical protein BH11ACT3_BH11ACT3_13130 [soil metagenome]
MNYDFADFVANIVFFVPVGLIAALLLSRRLWWLAIPLGVSLSICIELGQLLFLPGRDASVTDVLANSTGTVIGAVIVPATRRATEPKRAAERTTSCGRR